MVVEDPGELQVVGLAVIQLLICLLIRLYSQNIVEHTTKKRKATIVPIIISSDKTQLTTFRNKTAYPVYLTLGNLPKNIRRKPSRQGKILLGYLPTTKLDHVANKESRRRSLANLFH